MVLHWADTDPASIDMDAMASIYGSEALNAYWSEMSYGKMKPLSFEAFGPASINLNERYEYESDGTESGFCLGHRMPNGVLVREGGGCGMKGCT